MPISESVLSAIDVCNNLYFRHQLTCGVFSCQRRCIFLSKWYMRNTKQSNDWENNHNDSEKYHNDTEQRDDDVDDSEHPPKTFKDIELKDSRYGGIKNETAGTITVSIEFPITYNVKWPRVFMPNTSFSYQDFMSWTSDDLIKKSTNSLSQLKRFNDSPVLVDSISNKMVAQNQTFFSFYGSTPVFQMAVFTIYPSNCVIIREVNTMNSKPLRTLLWNWEGRSSYLDHSCDFMRRGKMMSPFYNLAPDTTIWMHCTESSYNAPDARRQTEQSKSLKQEWMTYCRERMITNSVGDMGYDDDHNIALDHSTAVVSSDVYKNVPFFPVLTLERHSTFLTGYNHTSSKTGLVFKKITNKCPCCPKYNVLQGLLKGLGIIIFLAVIVIIMLLYTWIDPCLLPWSKGCLNSPLIYTNFCPD